MRHWSLTAAAAALAASMITACDDEGGAKSSPDAGGADAAPLTPDGGGGAGGAGGEGGAGGQGGAGGATPDAGPDPDAAAGGAGGSPMPDADVPDPDMGVMDAAIDAAPDGALPDALPPIIDGGAACGADMPCGEEESCENGACLPDLRPTVYRMIDGEVLAPESAAAELRAALLLAVEQGDLNLMFEPAGYLEDGRYRFYMGSGNPDANDDGQFDGEYVWRHNLPILDVIGHWRDNAGARRFHQDGNGTFQLNVPTGRVRNADGDQVSCFTRIPVVTEELLLQSTLGAEDARQLAGEVEGFITVEEIDKIQFEFGGATIRFRDFLEGDPPDRDTNGDGEADAYSFHLRVIAEPVPFDDPDETRDPDPPNQRDPACDQAN